MIISRELVVDLNMVSQLSSMSNINRLLDWLKTENRSIYGTNKCPGNVLTITSPVTRGRRIILSRARAIQSYRDTKSATRIIEESIGMLCAFVCHYIEGFTKSIQSRAIGMCSVRT